MVPIGSDKTAGHARVIDAEFAHIGCAAFDVGSFLAHLFFAALACNDDENGSSERQLVDAARITWETYGAGTKPTREMVGHVAGFTGCEIVRRVIGAAHAPEIDAISDDKLRAIAESRALRFGANLMRKFHAIEKFEEIIEEFQNTEDKSK
mmetsp:Transcript_31296/g.57767  ORF Transcript_31296/g.57767 Transcript_31296/m.57767 type:complete len:151 (-) Transcript_31296:29-481(-)